MVAVCGVGVSEMVAVCSGALTVVGALDGGGASFGVKVGLLRGWCWVHCSSYESGGGGFLGVGCSAIEASESKN